MYEYRYVFVKQFESFSAEMIGMNVADVDVIDGIKVGLINFQFWVMKPRSVVFAVHQPRIREDFDSFCFYGYRRRLYVPDFHIVNFRMSEIELGAVIIYPFLVKVTVSLGIIAAATDPEASVIVCLTDFSQDLLIYILFRSFQPDFMPSAGSFIVEYNLWCQMGVDKLFSQYLFVPT